MSKSNKLHQRALATAMVAALTAGSAAAASRQAGEADQAETLSALRRCRRNACAIEPASDACTPPVAQSGKPLQATASVSIGALPVISAALQQAA